MSEDVDILRERARLAAARGDVEGAVASLLLAAAQTHLDDREYDAVLRPLEELLFKRGDARGAMTVRAYLATGDRAWWKGARALFDLVPPVDRARVLKAQGRPSEAALEMERGGLVAASAVLRELASEWTAARALWSRLAQVTEGQDAYVAALVRFNLARCARRCDDVTQARQATVACVRLLEEAADHFESIGQRERAFDCFEVLVQVGLESGAQEDVLEGFVNSIRVLREDHLEHFALDYYSDAVTTLAARGETGAAAALAREAAGYARSLGRPSPAGAYDLKQAGLWLALAREHRGRGSPADLAENALLAAILALGEIGQLAWVGALYSELAQLDLRPERREHYARSAARYADARDEPLDTTEEPPRPRTSQTEVWHTDVLEWERAGSAAEACAEALLDPALPEVTRRRAMLARLTALELEGGVTPRGGPEETCVRLARELARLHAYVVLSPLERLFTRPEPRVRVAVLHAVQALPYKRSFATVRAGLRDPDPVVVEHAARAVEALAFPHAFDPLSRIFRESGAAAVRAAALRALTQIDTTEAAEFLLGVLRHGAPSDRDAALAALQKTRTPKFVDLALRAMPESPSPLSTTLAALVRRPTRN